jgi:hypothetical protein
VTTSTLELHRPSLYTTNNQTDFKPQEVRTKIRMMSTYQHKSNQAGNIYFQSDLNSEFEILLSS